MNTNWRTEVKSHFNVARQKIAGETNPDALNQLMSSIDTVIEDAMKGYIRENLPEFDFTGQYFKDLLETIQREFPDNSDAQVILKVKGFHNKRNKIQHEHDFATLTEVIEYADVTQKYLNNLLAENIGPEIISLWNCPRCKTENRFSDRYCLNCKFDRVNEEYMQIQKIGLLTKKWNCFKMGA